LWCLGEHGIRKGFSMNINYPKFSGGPLAIDDRTILDRLIQKEKAQEAPHVLAFRKTRAERLATIEAAAEVSFPKLRVARDRANAAAIVAETEWRKACDVAQQAQRDLSSASHTHSTEQLRLEQQLIETASPEIALFLSDMRDEWEKCFKKFGFSNSVETVNKITGKKTDVTVNNRPSVMARQAAIRDAQAAAEAMRLEPDQSTVPARLQELRNNLPAIAGI
jgi:hypothetical protein